MRSYPNAAQGLKYLFYAEIVAVAATLLIWVPLLGSILALVSLVLSLVGLNMAGRDHQGFHTAFTLSIVALVISVVSTFLGIGILGAILNVISAVVNLAIVYYVVTTASILAHIMDNEELPRKGRTVWTLYLVCSIIVVMCSVLMVVPLVNLVAVVVTWVVAIIQLVAYILYMIFLYSGSKVLA